MTTATHEFLFSVDPRVFERFPNYIVGCVSVSGIDNAEHVDAVDRLLEDAEEALRRRLSAGDLKAVPEIAAWRDAFAACGWTPSKFPSSVEALVKRVLRGDALPRINPIVDLVNVAVLTHLVPIGAHDLATLPEDALKVRSGTNDDTFQPMGDSPDEVPDTGEIIYASGNSVRTRRWVWRQSRSALVSSTTRRVFVPVDGFSPATSPNVDAGVAFLCDAFAEHLGASTTHGFVNLQQPAFSSTL